MGYPKGMNITRSAVALSLVIASATFARAQQPAAPSSDQVVAAVDKAISRAEQAEKILPTVPVEYAGMLMTIAYASEVETPGNPDAAAVAALLEAKSSYWRAAAAALRAENNRLSDDIDEMTRNGHNGVEDAIARSMKLSRTLAAVAAIVADIEADQAVLSSGAPGGQAMLDRKAALCRRLIAQKPSKP